MTKRYPLLLLLFIALLASTGADAQRHARGYLSPTLGGPTITTSSPLPAGTVSSAYSTTVSETGGATPVVWSITSCTPCTGSWASINSSSGTITGTPGTAETESITVHVVDALSNTANKTFSLTVNSGGAGSPTVTTSSPLPGGTVSSAYSTTIAASGGTTPYVWSITLCTPCTGSWASINSSTGAITGTPGTSEVESITVLVTDAMSNTGSKNFSLTVSAGGAGPSAVVDPQVYGQTTSSTTLVFQDATESGSACSTCTYQVTRNGSNYGTALTYHGSGSGSGYSYSYSGTTGYYTFIDSGASNSLCTPSGSCPATIYTYDIIPTDGSSNVGPGANMAMWMFRGKAHFLGGDFEPSNNNSQINYYYPDTEGCATCGPYDIGEYMPGTGGTSWNMFNGGINTATQAGGFGYVLGTGAITSGCNVLIVVSLPANYGTGAAQTSGGISNATGIPGGTTITGTAGSAGCNTTGATGSYYTMSNTATSTTASENMAFSHPMPFDTVAANVGSSVQYVSEVGGGFNYLVEDIYPYQSGTQMYANVNVRGNPGDTFNNLGIFFSCGQTGIWINGSTSGSSCLVANQWNHVKIAINNTTASVNQGLQTCSGFSGYISNGAGASGANFYITVNPFTETCIQGAAFLFGTGVPADIIIGQTHGLTGFASSNPYPLSASACVPTGGCTVGESMTSQRTAYFELSNPQETAGTILLNNYGLTRE